MRNYKAADVDHYINNSDPVAHDTLRAIRKTIKAAVPEAEEYIKWGIPFYMYYGMLGGFSVFKKHATFGLSFVFSDEDRKDLESKGYKTGIKTVQIQFDQKVPTKEITRILKTKAEMNKAAKLAKK
jgi:uncharacterized protein YdhG (YjbR/CyaY superfamily)